MVRRKSSTETKFGKMPDNTFVDFPLAPVIEMFTKTVEFHSNNKQVDEVDIVVRNRCESFTSMEISIGPIDVS